MKLLKNPGNGKSSNTVVVNNNKDENTTSNDPKNVGKILSLAKQNEPEQSLNDKVTNYVFNLTPTITAEKNAANKGKLPEGTVLPTYADMLNNNFTLSSESNTNTDTSSNSTFKIITSLNSKKE